MTIIILILILILIIIITIIIKHSDSFLWCFEKPLT